MTDLKKLAENLRHAADDLDPETVEASEAVRALITAIIKATSAGDCDAAEGFSSALYNMMQAYAVNAS